MDKERSSIALLAAVVVGALAGCTPSSQSSVSSYASLEQKALDAEKAEAEIAKMIAAHGKTKDEKAATKASDHEIEKNAKKPADKSTMDKKTAEKKPAEKKTAESKAHATKAAAAKEHATVQAKHVAKTVAPVKAKDAAKANPIAKDKADHPAKISAAFSAEKPRQLASKPEATPSAKLSEKASEKPNTNAEVAPVAGASTASTAGTAIAPSASSTPVAPTAGVAPAATTGAAPGAPTTAVAARSKSLVYVVQIGAFRVKDNAERFQQKLKGEGFPVLMRSLKHSKNGELFLVRMEPTPNKTEAEEWVAQLKAKASLTSTIIALPEGD